MFLFLQFATRSDVKSIFLPPGNYLVGRADSSDIIIKNNTVSRKHCRFSFDYQKNVWVVEDLNSKNGVIINGRRIQRFELKGSTNLFVGVIPIIAEPIEAEDVLPRQISQLPFVLKTEEDVEELTEVIFSGVVEPKISRKLEVFLQSFHSPEGFEEKLLEILKEVNIEELGLVKEEGEELLYLTAHSSSIAEKIYRDRALSEKFSVELPGERMFHNFPLVFPWFEGSYYLVTRTTHMVVYQLEAYLVTIFKLYTLMLTKQWSRKVLSREEDLSTDEFIFVSPVMKEIISNARIIAEVEGNVLIEGETGVGKEVIARVLHLYSRRRSKPFIIVNSTAIPEGLADSELFGIEGGVATGVHEKQGKFEIAHGGVVFLDEIADMPDSIQAKILRFIEIGEIYRVGSNLPRKVDVWVISATNKNIDEELAKGRFRPDLFYRLCTFRIKVPPLRQRKEDILPIAYFYGRKFSQKLQRPFEGFTLKARKAFLTYDWPGNVRELKNEMERLLSKISDDGVISYRMLSDKIKESISHRKEEASDLNLQQRVESLEKELIKKALILSEGNKTRAANLLGLSRVGLLKKLKKYNLDL